MIQTFVERSWKWRRWFIGVQLALINCAIAYILIYGRDDMLHRDLSQGLILLLGTILNVYVLGGVWDDRNKDKAEIAHKAVDQSSPATTETKVDVQ